MLDLDHGEILKQGVDVWNLWKNQHPNIPLDFTWFTLNRANLVGVNLSKGNFTRATLFKNTLTRANFNEANLTRANFIEAFLFKASLMSANLTDASLIEANLVKADLSYANLCGANLYGANLSDADLTNTNLMNANLMNANLNHVNLSRANLTRTDLSWADLSHADLFEVTLTEADLATNNYSETALTRDPSESTFAGTNLRGTNLTNTNLINANLRGANLSEANFTGADLTGADFTLTEVAKTLFVNVNLSGVQGLDTVRHIGPSIIGIDTIVRSQGNIPEIFLRRAGVPESIIENIPALINAMKPIEYYTCFISYSSKDNKFAQRLHADLQDNGVRCWFASHDMKIGDKIRQRIDESIRMYDKLLLILSQDSVRSAWVETEVEKAFSKEKRKKKDDVLFPIRLDDAVLGTKQAWASEIKQTRHIGDFTDWKDYDSYQEAFNRLLRDLKAEGKRTNKYARGKEAI